MEVIHRSPVAAVMAMTQIPLQKIPLQKILLALQQLRPLVPQRRKKRFYTRVDNDQYITIYNPSKQTLYLDSLAIVTNQIDPRVIFEFAPGDNFVNSYYGVNSIMCFPGKGHDYPVKPGQTIVIANHAIDHAKDYEKISR